MKLAYDTYNKIFAYHLFAEIIALVLRNTLWSIVLNLGKLKLDANYYLFKDHLCMR